MEILFLHPNFPAQFKHLTKAFADNGHKTRFICQTHYGRTIKNVDLITLKNKAGHEALMTAQLSLFDRIQKMSKQYRHGLEEMKKRGYSPDIVISHSGFGCGLYVKEIWPNVQLISYLEWWFNPESPFFNYDPNNKGLAVSRSSITKSWKRNQNLALELSVSDAIVSPTQWQKNQLPKLLKNACEVVFDGIDLNLYKLDQTVAIRKNVITYGTRGMDPMRAFPQFISALPEILKSNQAIKVEIAGIDETNYGSAYKKSSWKQWAIELLSRHQLENRVRWVGRLGKGSYEKWLQSSSTHIYLSHPFVTSWSLVEAYCCFTPLVVSDIELTKEICSGCEGVTFADHRKSEELSQKIINHLERISTSSLSRTHLSRDVNRFGLSRSLEGWSRVSGVELTTTN
ncbi:glycosyltransferase [bacterium]|nr:glycosyltransferase [bacterium]